MTTSGFTSTQYLTQLGSGELWLRSSSGRRGWGTVYELLFCSFGTQQHIS